MNPQRSRAFEATGDLLSDSGSKKGTVGSPEISHHQWAQQSDFLRECCHLSTKEIVSSSVRLATPASKSVLAAKRSSPVKQKEKTPATDEIKKVKWKRK
jgi:hypothetical protein